MDMQELLDRAEYTIDYQKAEIDRLRSEIARLTAANDAHGTLKSIYTDPAASQTNRIKAASAALPVEKPKLLSIMALPEMDRREAWRVYQRWALRRQIIRETHDLPAPGWDAHLVGDTYQAPEGDDMPPVRVVSDPTSGFRLLDNLMSSTGTVRRNGNGEGNGGDGSSGASE